MRSTAMLGSTRRHVSELAGWIRLNEIGSDDLSLTLHRGLPDKRAVTQVTYTDPSLCSSWQDVMAVFLSRGRAFSRLLMSPNTCAHARSGLLDYAGRIDRTALAPALPPSFPILLRVAMRLHRALCGVISGASSCMMI